MHALIACVTSVGCYTCEADMLNFNCACNRMHVFVNGQGQPYKAIMSLQCMQIRLQRVHVFK